MVRIINSVCENTTSLFRNSQLINNVDLWELIFSNFSFLIEELSREI